MSDSDGDDFSGGDSLLAFEEAPMCPKAKQDPLHGSKMKWRSWSVWQCGTCSGLLRRHTASYQLQGRVAKLEREIAKGYAKRKGKVPDDDDDDDEDSASTASSEHRRRIAKQSPPFPDPNMIASVGAKKQKT